MKKLTLLVILVATFKGLAHAGYIEDEQDRIHDEMNTAIAETRNDTPEPSYVNPETQFQNSIEQAQEERGVRAEEGILEELQRQRFENSLCEQNGSCR